MIHYKTYMIGMSVILLTFLLTVPGISEAAWTKDTAGKVGLYTSIAIDTSGKPHISYTEETNKHLKYATNAAVALHRELGPGLLESAYEVILAYGLKKGEGLFLYS